MARTREELEQAAAEAEAWLDQLDPAEVRRAEATDLRRIALALRKVADANKALADAIAAARGNGRSWGQIGIVLGVSRQAARERFGNVSVPPRRSA